VKRIDEVATQSILCFIFVAALVAACRKQALPNDPQIREEIVGAWIPSDGKQGSVKFESDGSFTGTGGENGVRVAGTWSVENGFITICTTRSSPIKVIPVEKARLVKLDKNEMVFQPESQTNLLVLRDL
jgi:hypothetical protein